MSDEQIRINELKAQAERERRVTASMWKAEKAQTRRAAMEKVNLLLEECWASLKELNRVIEEKYDRNQMPGLSNLQKALDGVHTEVKKILEEKRLEEPDEVEETQETSVGEDGVVVKSSGGEGSVSGAINDRKDALRRLAEIAAFFQKTEPHSPVSYLVQRAVKWGNMGLETWLKEVIKDQTVLYQLRETLGVDNAAESSDSGATVYE
jgi:type VI secretion system protein ImpA